MVQRLTIKSFNYKRRKQGQRCSRINISLDGYCILTISPHCIACPSTPLLSGSAKNPSRPAESISQFLSRYASRSFTDAAFSGTIFSERDFFNRPCKSDSHLGLTAPFSDARGGGVAADDLADVMKARADNGRMARGAP